MTRWAVSVGMLLCFLGTIRFWYLNFYFSADFEELFFEGWFQSPVHYSSTVIHLWCQQLQQRCSLLATLASSHSSGDSHEGETLRIRKEIGMHLLQLLQLGQVLVKPQIIEEVVRSGCPSWWSKVVITCFTFYRWIQFFSPHNLQSLLRFSLSIFQSHELQKNKKYFIQRREMEEKRQGWDKFQWSWQGVNGEKGQFFVYITTTDFQCKLNKVNPTKYEIFGNW